MTRPAWIDDHCDNPRITPLTPERAVGIQTLHAACTPPCPRRITARDYLAILPEGHPCTSKSV